MIRFLPRITQTPVDTIPPPPPLMDDEQAGRYFADTVQADHSW